MPETGEYLFTHVGFSKDEKPLLSLQRADKLLLFQPLGQTISLVFDTSTRHCTGWYDMRLGESHICPDAMIIEGKYEQCPACQKRTGFNPAFYHATSVSDQQEARNLEPHMLYLAYFSAEIIKVGISHAARNNSRLLEQGARSALILDVFPTAHIARQYEAKIAALPNIVETVQLRKKISALARDYDAVSARSELEETRAHIEKILGTTFAKNDTVALDSIFFPTALPDLKEAYDLSDQNLISGNAVGMLGSLLFCQIQETLTLLPLKKYLGYSVILSYEEIAPVLPARQTSLF